MALQGFQVVDVEELKGDVRTKVDDIVAHTKQEDIKSLRISLEATPEALSALKAKGRITAQGCHQYQQGRYSNDVYEEDHLNERGAS